MDIFFFFLSLNYFSHLYIDPTTISTSLCVALILPLSMLSAVRSKSEKHVSLGGVIGWNNNISKEREREREKEQKDVSNRQDNGLSKSDIQRRGKSMIDECVSRNFGEKRFDINMTASIEWQTERQKQKFSFSDLNHNYME